MLTAFQQSSASDLAASRSRQANANRCKVIPENRLASARLDAGPREDDADLGAGARDRDAETLPGAARGQTRSRFLALAWRPQFRPSTAIRFTWRRRPCQACRRRADARMSSSTGNAVRSSRLDALGRSLGSSAGRLRLLETAHGLLRTFPFCGDERAIYKKRMERRCAPSSPETDSLHVFQPKPSNPSLSFPLPPRVGAGAQLNFMDRLQPHSPLVPPWPPSCCSAAAKAQPMLVALGLVRMS